MHYQYFFKFEKKKIFCASVFMLIKFSTSLRDKEVRILTVIMCKVSFVQF